MQLFTLRSVFFSAGRTIYISWPETVCPQTTSLLSPFCAVFLAFFLFRTDCMYNVGTL